MFDPPRVIRGIARFGSVDNYADNFGFQWNRFTKTQFHRSSDSRLWATTGWDPRALDGLDILEVGSGAGRFSRVILEKTRANLYTVDYSIAVEANYESNAQIAPDRMHIAQASIYELPFPDGSFDKTFCLGVLQHTPDFEASVKALVAKTKTGGEIIVDFYQLRGWWTKIHAKYLLRPITRQMSNTRLLALVERNVDWLSSVHNALTRIGLHALTRFLPLVDVASTIPKDLPPDQIREWAILDTFDMFSPEYDNPQHTSDVVAMFERAGAKVIYQAPGMVRAVKPPPPSAPQS